MKKNKQKLLLTQALSGLGNAVVGIFFPFLVGRAFGLSYAGIIFWMVAINICLIFAMYPINFYMGKKLSTEKMIQLGLFLQAIFLAIIGLASQHIFWFLLAGILYVFHLCVFWPSFHVALLHSSCDGKRGDFIGSIHLLLVGVNLVAPLLSGFLLDLGKDWAVALISVVFFLLAMFSLQNIHLPKQKLSPFKESWKFFLKEIWYTRYRLGLITDGIQGEVLWIIWPLFLGIVLGKFALMGMVVAIAAVGEMISAKIFGKLTDKYSAKKVLRMGMIARFFDIGVRALLIKFPTMLWAGIVSVNAGILGPIYNISFYNRLCEIAEDTEPKVLEFFLAREWLINVVRVVWLSLAALAVLQWGEMALGWVIGATALLSFGYRRF